MNNVSLEAAIPTIFGELSCSTLNTAHETQAAETPINTTWTWNHVRACVCVCVRACVRVCVRVCV